MRELIKMKFGSHLYGTQTAYSDLDYKAVHVPDAKDILLGQVRGSITERRSKGFGEKNQPGEIETESYSLLKYFDLLSQGQTVALDMLFAPQYAYVDERSSYWQMIIDNRHRLLTKNSAAFVGYCKKQAAKYGIKGSRVAAALAVMETLEYAGETIGYSSKLYEMLFDLIRLVSEQEYVTMTDIPQKDGSVITYLEVCGKKLSLKTSVKNALDTVRKLVDAYGQRAIQAKNQEGIDWKALSHAVRAGHQAIELLNYGHITFPLTNAAHIIDIKLGNLRYQHVAEQIEDLLELVKMAELTSDLPDTIDREWAKELVVSVYGDEVLEYFDLNTQGV